MGLTLPDSEFAQRKVPEGVAFNWHKGPQRQIVVALEKGLANGKGRHGDSLNFALSTRQILSVPETLDKLVLLCGICSGLESMDIGAEDPFYENMTLGLVSVLGNTPGIRNVRLEKRPPCERPQISTWEQRHSCLLPNDIKQFYLSTDGFQLTWNYEHAGEVLPIGHMKINAIADLRRIGGVKPQEDSDCPSLFDVELCSPKTDFNRPRFSVRCKIFEMDSCQGSGRVCLVYLDKSEADGEKREKPKIWLLDRSFDWHFIADSFTQYFRMMLVHQGLPQWQLKLTSMGLTQFAEQMMVLIAPHLLQANNAGAVNEWPSPDHGPVNHLDPTIFRTFRDKTVKKKDPKGDF